MMTPNKSVVSCPNCGAPVNRKYGETVVCEYCGTAIRPSDSERKTLAEQDRQAAERLRQQASLECQRQEERRRLERECERRDCESVPKRQKISLKSWLALILPVLFLIGFSYFLCGVSFGFFNPAVLGGIIFVFLGCVIVYGCLP